MHKLSGSQSGWSLLAGRIVGAAILGTLALGGLFLFAGVTLVALVFLVGLTTLGVFAFLVGGIVRRLQGRPPVRRGDPRVIDADYRVVEDGQSSRRS